MSAYSGSAFVELNSYTAASLFQDFIAPLGSQVTLSFAHRARVGPVDVMSVELGQGGVFTFVDPSVADGLTWVVHTYIFTLPTLGSTTFTLRLSAVSTGTGNLSVGNFLDDVQLSVVGTDPLLSLASTATCTGLSDGTATAVIADGTAPFTYSWSPAGGTGATAAALPPGTYVCTIFDASGCTDKDSVVVVGLPTPVVSLTSTTTTCYDSANGTATVAVQSGTQPYIYLWSPPISTGANATGLTPGTYSCGVTDANGCDGNGSATITGPMAVVLTGTDIILCNGDNATLQAGASGGTPGYTFSWSPQGPAVAPDTTTDYTVEAMDANGCLSAMDTVTVTVPTLPPVLFTTDTTAGCAPACIAFDTEPFTGLFFQWDFGDGESGSGPAVVHCYPTGGTYDIALTLTDANGCSQSASEQDLITVWEPVVPIIGTSSQLVVLDAPLVDLNDESVGTVEWQWDLGDGSDIATERSPSHSFRTADCFMVTLTTTDIHTCTGSDSVQICVKDVSSPPFVPNAFTPDGDGINDVLRVINVSAGAKGFEFLIFDRWGGVIFSSASPDRAWDGAGTPLGIYAWKLRYQEVEGGGRQYNGHVTLLR